MIAGSLLRVWPCRELEASIDINHPYMTDDIPITLLQNDKKITTYADTRSFIIKNNTKRFPFSSVITPSYLIDSIWYCWEGSIKLCSETPEKISVNVTSIKQSLNLLMENTKFAGGISEEKYRAEFRRIVELPISSSNLLFGLSSQIILNSFDQLKHIRMF